MDNPGYTDDVDIEMDDIPPDDDDDIYNTPNTTRIDEEEETPILETGTSTLQLKQQILRNKLDSLYHYLGTKGSLDLIDFDRFKMKTNSKTVLLIYYGITVKYGYL